MKTISDKLKRILITGFEPFGDDKMNSSEIVLENLPYFDFVEIHKELLPVSFSRSVRTVINLLNDIKPDIVISLGQARNRNSVDIERIAINIDDCRNPDNDGVLFKDTKIIENGPDALFSTLPVRSLSDAVLACNVQSKVSNSAGTFVCNHLLYSILYYIKDNNLPVKAGFIHLPCLAEQKKDNLDMQSFSLKDLLRVMDVIIRNLIINF